MPTTPSYPTAVKSFTEKVDNTDKVVAADINAAYAEITAIESQMGTGGVAVSPAVSGTYVNGFNDWSNSGGLAARLKNIEVGVGVLAGGIDGGTP